MLPAILTAFCFAGAAVSARRSASLVGPLWANQLRLLIAVILLGGMALITWERMSSGILARFLFAGGIGFGLGGFCMMQALKRLGSPRALLSVESVTAVLAGGISWSYLGDRLGPFQILACLIILAGILLAGSTWIRERPDPSRHHPSGYVFALGASVFQAISLVMSRDAFLIASAKQMSVEPLNAAFVRLMGGLVIAFLLLAGSSGQLLKAGNPKRFRVALIRRDEPLGNQPLLWASANALAGPVFGVSCWLWAVSLINPGIVQSIAATAPLISIPLSRKLEWNQLGARFYTGSMTAISGIALLALC